MEAPLTAAEQRSAPDETVRLILRAQAGDEGAAEQLAGENLALVKSIVRRFLGRGVEYDDLMQLGSVGLIKAIRNFDAQYNVRFSTYAVPMIMGEIRRYLRDDGAVKVSRPVRELAMRASSVRSQLASRLGREPGVGEIASQLGESAEDVAMALEAFRPAISLNQCAFDDDRGESRLEYLTSQGEGEEAFLDRLLLKELLGRLNGREKQIIVMRYFQDKTQSEIAAVLGVSQVQISRLESKILLKLRAMVQEPEAP